MAEAQVLIDTEEDNQSQRGRCREELRGQRLRSCQRYLQRGGRQGGRQGGGWYIRSRGDQYEDESLDQCCRELKRVDDRCRCQAIERALDEAQREEGQQGRRYDEDERQGRYGGRGQRQSQREGRYEGRGQSHSRGGRFDEYGRGGDRGDDSRDRDQMTRRAENLPNRCRLNRPQRCEIRGSYN
ncbi:2S albumin seed storage protein PINP1-like [Telopea speciosissima]|uniref:2S albumin seed storage protein PINP1-like n=1 Tax=Telopea speciosissima TaxID=54955 RepID=UPI001CC6096F|nr:2S albumin seed storage protein PINP1-like [Telopea speciosissima]